MQNNCNLSSTLNDAIYKAAKDSSKRRENRKEGVRQLIGYDHEQMLDELRTEDRR